MKMLHARDTHGAAKGSFQEDLIDACGVECAEEPIHVVLKGARIPSVVSGSCQHPRPHLPKAISTYPSLSSSVRIIPDMGVSETFQINELIIFPIEMAIDIINLALNFNLSGPHPHISNIILWLNDIPFYPHETGYIPTITIN